MQPPDSSVPVGEAKMRGSKYAFSVGGVALLVAGVAGAVWGFTSDSLMADGVAYAGLSVGFVGLVFLLVALYFGKLDTTGTLRNGIPGTAQVISVQDTGVTVNNLNMVVKLGLLVSIGGHAPYQAEVRHVLRGRTAWGSIQPGMTFPVKVDPNDMSTVAIDASPMAAALAGFSAAPPSGGRVIGAPAMAPSGQPQIVTMSAADIIARGVKLDGTLISAASTGMTAGQAVAGLPTEQADDPIVHVVFSYRPPGSGELRQEALVRVPDGKSHLLVPGSTVPIAVLADAPSTATIDWTRG
jgi:hypothetical protein